MGARFGVARSCRGEPPQDADQWPGGGSTESIRSGDHGYSLTMTALTRRQAVTGTAALGLGVPILAACGGADTSAESGDGGPASDSGEVLADVSEVPEGGCFVVTAAKIVVTQPNPGEFKAFSAICTHQGCPVSSATEGVIPCQCHGSQFSLMDGSVVRGPATSALAKVDIVVDGDVITQA